MPTETRTRIPDPPGAERRGWPWEDVSEDAGAEAGAAEDAPPSAAPLVSIVIPSYNQGEYIEETIRSIVMQRYPNFEIIVIDGGSTDSTLEVIRRCEPWLTHWVSEKDSGQANAINKGLAVARGEIVTWLNSDDLLLPGAFDQLARAYARNADTFFISPVEHFLDGTDKSRVFVPENVTHRNLVEFWTRRAVWNDPGTFYTRAVLDRIGFVDESYRYAFDYDFILRATRSFEPTQLPRPTTRFRVHSQSKTISEGEKFIYETARVSKTYWGGLGGRVNRRGFERYFAVWMFRSGILNARRDPSAALDYFWQGFRTHMLLSPFWFLQWGAKVVRERAGRAPGEWNGFVVE
jgi:glycosyltransferase involved in cell wall biosynthesis